MEAGTWVWDNFDRVSGISFLPKSDHVYAQAPYEEISLKEYEELLSIMPNADFINFQEDSDRTTSSQELACVAGACEIVDVS